MTGALDGLTLGDLHEFVESHGGRSSPALAGKSMVDVYYRFVRPTVQDQGHDFLSIFRRSNPRLDNAEIFVVIFPWNMEFMDFLIVLETCAEKCTNSSRPRAYWIDFFCINCCATYGSISDNRELHDRWAKSVCSAVDDSSGAIVMLESWDKLDPIKTSFAMYSLNAMASTGRPMEIGMSPSEWRRFENVVTADQRLTHDVFSLTGDLRDYDCRSFPGGQVLRDSLVQSGWTDVHHCVGQLISQWLHSQTR